MKRADLLSLNTSGTAHRSRTAAPTSPLRCLAVWAALTTVALIGSVLGGAAVVDTLPMLSTLSTPPTSTAPISIDQVVVMGAGMGALAICPWLWFIATLSVVEALRGRVSTRTGWTRRLTLLACGVAVTTGVLAPAHAATDPPRSGGAVESISLDGLPYPDRASSSSSANANAEKTTHRPRSDDLPLQVSTPTAAEPGGAPDRRHRVREGDTLWAIAAASSPSVDLPRAVAELHLKNRRVIGANPDLIHPGQVLDLHSEGDESR